MGKLRNRVPMVGRAPIVDGNLSAVVDLSDDTTTVHTGAGRLLGWIINTILSAQVLPVKDDSTLLFTLPSTAAVTGLFVPIGPDGEGIEFLTSLVIDPDDAASGSVTFVYQPYPDDID